MIAGRLIVGCTREGHPRGVFELLECVNAFALHTNKTL